MEEEQNIDILDSGNVKPLQKKLWTIRLLIIGGALIVLTFLAAALWEVLGLTEDDTIWLAVSLMFAFGINLAGFISGLTELKLNRKRALFGTLGNLLLVLLFIAFVAYSISTIPAKPTY